MTVGEIFVSHLGVILLGSAALLFLIGAFVGLANSDFYSSLTRTEQGRGLITFLFALTATAVILIISIAIFWFENTDDLSKRIVPAKDVLTVVIGVLGTIMGFYFGSTTDARLSIGNLALSPAIATVTDKTVKLQARVIGGTAPYQYTISFGETSVSKSSPNALIEESLDISKLSGLTHAVITIAVTDARGNQAHSSTVLPIQAGTGQPAPPQNTPGPATPPTNP